MNEWAVVGIIAAVAGAAWSIIKGVAGVIQPLTKEITTLNCTMKTVTADMGELTRKNSESHKRIFDKIDAQDDTLKDHEIRIVKLEERKENDR